MHVFSSRGILKEILRANKEMSILENTLYQFSLANKFEPKHLQYLLPSSRPPLLLWCFKVCVLKLWWPAIRPSFFALWGRKKTLVMRLSYISLCGLTQTQGVVVWATSKRQEENMERGKSSLIAGITEWDRQIISHAHFSLLKLCAECLSRFISYQCWLRFINYNKAQVVQPIRDLREW